MKVRQAINYAIDRAAMLKAVGKGYGTTTTQVFSRPTPPVSTPRWTRCTPIDPAKAKQLLAAAGYANGFTLTMPESRPAVDRLRPLKQYLGDGGDHGELRQRTR